jgi:hypothetical protein
MSRVFRALNVCTAGMSGVVALALNKLVLDNVENGPGVGSHVLWVALAIVLLCASGYFIGLLHGWSFGLQAAEATVWAATTPVGLFLLFATLATWLLASPFLLGGAAFPWLTFQGVKHGARLPGACKYAGPHEPRDPAA